MGAECAVPDCEMYGSIHAREHLAEYLDADRPLVRVEHPIAHNALGDEDGAYLPALRYLKSIGYGLFGAGLTVTKAASGEVFERIDLGKAEKRMALGDWRPVPGGPVAEAVQSNENQKPLGARRR
jgi:hypothetical protein